MFLKLFSHIMKISYMKKFSHMKILYVKSSCAINLFINSDAILNRDALWSIQGKKQFTSAIVGGIHHTGKILR